MPRARTKQQLLDFGKAEFETLLKHVTELTEDQLTKKMVFDNRTTKDILAHLHAWHKLELSWYKEGMAGKKPEIPAPGYTFKDAPALNEKLFQEYKAVVLQEVLSLLKKSHNEIIEIVQKHSDAELTTKKKYAWTGSTDMCSYFASALSSHYVWANDLIKKFKKTL
jgi:hypothetical protein